MEHKLIATYTFLTGTPCNASYVALSCQRGPLTSFLLSTAINVTLLFPGNKKKKVPLQRKLLKFLLHNAPVPVNAVLS